MNKDSEYMHPDFRNICQLEPAQQHAVVDEQERKARELLNDPDESVRARAAKRLNQLRWIRKECGALE